MSRRIMQHNLTNLLRQAEYQSGSSDLEPVELHELRDEHSPYIVSQDEEQLVNPFDKKLFRDGRLRRSSVYSSIQPARLGGTATKNKSMAHLINHQQQRADQREVEICFEKSINILETIRRKIFKISQLATPHQLVNSREQSQLCKLQQHLQYINEYLLYHYPLDDDELIGIHDTHHREKTLDESVKRGQNECIYDLYGFSVSSDTANQENQAYRSNCHVLHHNHQIIEQKDDSKYKATRKSRQLHPQKHRANKVAPKSIYESVLEQRKLKRSKKNKFT